ncbi:NUDIX domain-containing protein [Paenibacillus sp. sgz302251]|uniref:NUDIX domain-containing protein n=1 Tax=Paenibacillus sp. sgz302251 TaxID=3414493 RepID=UPI003C7E5B28
MKVRSGVKGIVISKNKLLTIKKYDEQFGADYTLPGGGQEHGENLIDALKREFLEEVGCHIKVKQFAFVREYIGKNHHGNSMVDPKTHVVDHIFLCDILDEQKEGHGTAPDEDHLAIEWSPISNLEDYRFFPVALIPYIRKIAEGHIVASIYTGDIN